MACPHIQLFKVMFHSVLSFSALIHFISKLSQCTIMSTSFQFHCNYLMKAAIMSCLDYANYLLIDISAVTMTPHVP